MLFAELCRWTAGAVTTVILILAGISDVRVRRIPNWMVLVVLGFFVPWAAGFPLAPLSSAAIAFAIAAAVTLPLYAFKILGAGDCKLFCAVSLYAGLPDLLDLAVVTTLTGGLIAVVSLASRPTRALVMFHVAGKGDFGRGVPYGVAIAVGGLAVIAERLAGWSAFAI